MNIISSETEGYGVSSLLYDSSHQYTYIQKGAVFDVSDDALYILQEGVLWLEIVEQGSDFPSQIIALQSGDVVGLLSKYINGFSFCYRATGNCVLFRLTDNFTEETTPFSGVLLNALSTSVCRLLIDPPCKTGEAKYNVIRDLIYQYMDMKRSQLLNDETLLSFILERVVVSREYVTTILSELADSAYIDIREGKLNAINMTLPAEYRIDGRDRIMPSGETLRLAC